jgi:uncharacterized spore protein YtfJ
MVIYIFKKVKRSGENQMTNQIEKPQAPEEIKTVQSTLEKFTAIADVTSVYGNPIQNGDTTIIPAAEVLCVMGFGVGSGSGMDENNQGGGGEGGGGGGRVFSRPVAAIIIEGNNVRVEPVVDVTKITLGLFTTIGFVAGMVWRMKRTKLRL